ncbi:hypothetical protein D3C78_1904510 [compost metagenome]
METALRQNEIYIKGIQKVLKGELEYSKFNKDSILAESVEDPSDLNMKASDAEMKLREDVAKTEKELKAESKDKKKSDKK